MINEILAIEMLIQYAGKAVEAVATINQLVLSINQVVITIQNARAQGRDVSDAELSAAMRGDDAAQAKFDADIKQAELDASAATRRNPV